MGKFKKSLLNEDIKLEIAKSKGLEHISFNNYKDKSGNIWIWDNEDKEFSKSEGYNTNKVKDDFQKVTEQVYKNKMFTNDDNKLMSLEDALKVSFVGLPGISRRNKINLYNDYKSDYELDVRRKSFGSGASYNKETNLANKK